MDVSVFGLGYVGVVSAACLARDGHTVVGVDVEPEKVEMLEAGKTPVYEPGLDELVREAVKLGRLRCTTTAEDAVASSEVSLISVGTPSRADGSANLDYVYAVVQQIATIVKQIGRADHTIVIRSTVPPGTSSHCAELVERIAGANVISIAFNPEFLREGSAVSDFAEPAYTVVAATDERGREAVKALYREVEAPLVTLDLPEAELLKTCCNAWHAVKVVFANEIGRIAKGLKIDGRNVMDAIIRDTKLNISGKYLRPGFAYGGSCLPKDVRSLVHLAGDVSATIPLLQSLSVSNAEHVTHTLGLVLQTGASRIGLLGLAFKPGTDDLRESPALELARQMIAHGLDVHIFDPIVMRANLFGANLRYAESSLPDLKERLTDDMNEFLEDLEVVVAFHKPDVSMQGLGGENLRMLIDLSGMDWLESMGCDYEGVAW